MRRLFRSHSHQAVAANGLLDRRLFLRGGAGAALAFGGIVLPDVAASSEPLRVEPWMKVPGSPFVGYGPGVLSMALARFRMAWRWNGGPAILQSRAADETGYVQPTRAELIAKRGTKAYHFNGVTSWGVAESGEVKHVYA
jgi:hypothetical protein